MYLCREHTKSSLPEIGKHFGGKDHTTVIFSHKKISNSIANRILCLPLYHDLNIRDQLKIIKIIKETLKNV